MPKDRLFPELVTNCNSALVLVACSRVGESKTLPLQSFRHRFGRLAQKIKKHPLSVKGTVFLPQTNCWCVWLGALGSLWSPGFASLNDAPSCYTACVNFYCCCCSLAGSTNFSKNNFNETRVFAIPKGTELCFCVCRVLLSCSISNSTRY